MNDKQFNAFADWFEDYYDQLTPKARETLHGADPARVNALYGNYRSQAPGVPCTQEEFTEKMQPFLCPYTRAEEIGFAEQNYEAREDRKAAWMDFAAVARAAGTPLREAWCIWRRGLKESNDPWWYQAEEAESAKAHFIEEWQRKFPARSEEEAEDAWLEGYCASPDDDPWWWKEESK